MWTHARARAYDFIYVKIDSGACTFFCHLFDDAIVLLSRLDSMNLPMNFFITAQFGRESIKFLYRNRDKHFVAPLSFAFGKTFAGNDAKYCILHWRIVIHQTRKITTRCWWWRRAKRNEKSFSIARFCFGSSHLISSPIFNAHLDLLPQSGFSFHIDALSLYMPLSIFFINSPLPFFMHFVFYMWQPHSHFIFHLTSSPSLSLFLQWMRAAVSNVCNWTIAV